MTILNVMNDDKKLYMNPDSPCINCLVVMTCTKSVKDKTICNDYKQFILTLVENEKNESEKRFRNK